MTITNLKMLRKFTSLLFPREDQAWKAAMIIQGILKVRSPRITEVARAIPKPFFAGHKMIYRFLKKTPLKRRSCGCSARTLPSSSVIPPRSSDPRPKGPLMWAGSRTGRPGVSSLWSSPSPTKEGPSPSGSLSSHPPPSPSRKPPGTWCTLGPSSR